MEKYRYWLLSLSALALLVYIIGAVRIDVMDIDSSHYAEMSREMNETGDYLVIKNRIIDDYLDKPPLIFWFTAVMYSFFGTSPFIFRIPAILASLLGAYSVYKFTRLFYDKESGMLAALLLLSSQVYFLYNHNFLTDTLLTNFTIFSVWQLSAFLKHRRWPYFLGAFTGLALAMMSKGPLGLLVPVVGFSLHFIYKRQWRNFLRWEWLAGIMLIFILLLPMMVGLYRQYGRLGLQFFFWTQSFGRITGQSHWHNQSSPFFFVHTFLWFFLPWTILSLYALFRNIWKVFVGHKSRFRLPEIITTGGFVIVFLALSLSRYKLPQYIFVLIPLAAAFTAPAITHIIRERPSLLKRLLIGSSYFFAAIYWLALAGILLFFFPDHVAVPWIVFCTGLVTIGYLLFHRQFSTRRVVMFLAVTVITANFIMNWHFYPRILHFQTGAQIASYWGQSFRGEELYYYRYHSPALDFHLAKAPPVINHRKLERLASMKDGVWVVTDQTGRESLEEEFISKEIPFERYPVQALSLKFLNKKTRDEVLSKDYLIRVRPGDKYGY